MDLVIKITRKPLFVRQGDGPWHCLTSPGGPYTRCSVSFDTRYHPDKVPLYPDAEGLPEGPRCTRNGCKQQFAVMDTLLAAIVTKRAEIEVAMPEVFRNAYQRTYEGRANGCAYCGATLPADDHPITVPDGFGMPVMTCPTMPEGKIIVRPAVSS